MAYSMMRPKQPCLEVREGDVNHRKVGICFFWVSVKHQGFVRVAQFCQFIIAIPAIGMHNSAFSHTFLHKLRKFRGSTAWHEAQPQSARVDSFLVLLAFGAGQSGAYFDGPNNHRLMVDTTPLAFCTATNKRFVHFDRILISDSVTIWSRQTGAELVKHLKRRLIAGQA